MATLTKIHAFKINNIWTQISFILILLNKNISKTNNIFSCQNWENAGKSQKVIIRKSQKLLIERALSELHGGSLFRTFIANFSYSFNFNGGLRKRSTGFCLLQTPSPRGK